MRFDEIRSHLQGIPFISPERARVLYNFVLERQPHNCLELGTAHGASSCYVAAALDELGRGHLTTVDRISARKWQRPSVDDLLLRTGLRSYVTVAREQTSYNWFLKKMLETNTIGMQCTPIYDFCYIDGAKNWTIDGFAFFLVDKLLCNDGWILFDDYDWTYAATGRTVTDGVNHEELGDDELKTPHIELVVRLLMGQHPDYSEIKIQDGCWAWGHKTHESRKVLVFEETYRFKALLLRILRGTVRKLHLGELQGV